MDERDSKIIEALYDTLFHQDGWDSALTLAAQAFDSTSAGFFEHNPDNPADIEHCMHGIDDAMMNVYEQHYSALNPFFWTKGYTDSHKFMSDRTLIDYTGDRKIWASGEFYEDWLDPQDFAHTIGLALDTNGGRQLNFTLIRPQIADFYTVEEEKRFLRITRHLDQCIRLKRHIGALSLRSATSEHTLGNLQVGLLQLDHSGSIQFMNPYAAQLLYNVQVPLAEVGSKLVINGSPTSNTLLHSTLQLCRTTGQTQVVRLPNGQGHYLTLTATPNHDEKPFLNSLRFGTTVIIQDAETPSTEQQLMARYGLTTAEAEVAMRLAEGLSPQEISDQLGKAISTVRSQVKSIYQKTGVSKQLQLVALVHRLSRGQT